MWLSLPVVSSLLFYYISEVMWLNSERFTSDFQTKWPRVLQKLQNRVTSVTTGIFAGVIVFSWISGLPPGGTVGLFVMVIVPVWVFLLLDYARIICGRALYLQCLRSSKLEFREVSVLADIVLYGYNFHD